MKKEKAHQIANINITGKYTCEICGDPAKEKHHENYNEPLNVIHMCYSCHRKRHKYNKTFIESKAVIDAFNKHGFDIMLIVKKEIEIDAYKYIKYYKGYFIKDIIKKKGGDIKMKLKTLPPVSYERWSDIKKIATSECLVKRRNVPMTEILGEAIDSYVTFYKNKGEEQNEKSEKSAKRKA